MRRAIDDAVQLALALYFCVSVIVGISLQALGIDGDAVFYCALGVCIGLAVGTFITASLIRRRLE